jgi:hypothetical protein
MWSGFPCVDCRDISLKFFQFCFNCLTPHCTLSHCFLFACISTFLGEEIYSDPSFTSLSLSSARPRNFDPTSDIARTVRNSKPAIYDILNSYAAPRTLQDAGRSSVLGGVLPANMDVVAVLRHVLPRQNQESTGNTFLDAIGTASQQRVGVC